VTTILQHYAPVAVSWHVMNEVNFTFRGVVSRKAGSLPRDYYPAALCAGRRKLARDERSEFYVPRGSVE
jgi:hypothetical protein